MAIRASTEWRIRAGGDDTNGGGFDPAILGAGTDYTDQDAAQLSLTDLACSGGSTTLTSVTGGFTSAMVGNCIRISAGTNFTPGYYFIVAFTDTNTVTIDRVPVSGGPGSAGVGKLGGAFSWFDPLCQSRNGTISPPIASPLLAGNTVWIRGSGSDDPSTPDYSKSDGDFWQWSGLGGSVANGLIRYRGYNGRPFLQGSGLFWYTHSFITVEDMVLKHSSNAGHTSHGWVSTAGSSLGKNLKIDVRNVSGALGWSGTHLLNSLVTSSFTISGTGANGVNPTSFGGTVAGCTIEKISGNGVTLNTISGIRDCIIRLCNNHGILLTTVPSNYGTYVIGCDVYDNEQNGLYLFQNDALHGSVLLNNNFAFNGAYGVNCDVSVLEANDRRIAGRWDYNNFYGNTSGARNKFTAGANDTELDPQYVDASNGNFAKGTNLKALGFPSAFPGIPTTSYVDIGAVQREEQGSGSEYRLTVRKSGLSARL